MTLCLETSDVKAVVEKAVAVGAVKVGEVTEVKTERGSQLKGKVTDLFGITWNLVSPAKKIDNDESKEEDVSNGAPVTKSVTFSALKLELFVETGVDCTVRLWDFLRPPHEDSSVSFENFVTSSAVYVWKNALRAVDHQSEGKRVPIRVTKNFRWKFKKLELGFMVGKSDCSRIYLEMKKGEICHRVIKLKSKVRRRDDVEA